MVVDYSEGKIYKIVSKKSKLRYYGSTTYSLEHRLAGHFDDYYKWLKGNKKYVSSFKILRLGDVSIELLEEYPCRSAAELHEREEEWIELNRKKCVNMARPTQFHNKWVSPPFADDE